MQILFCFSQFSLVNNLSMVKNLDMESMILKMYINERAILSNPELVVISPFKMFKKVKLVLCL